MDYNQVNKLTRDQFYKMMTTILDKRQFEFNHELNTIKVSIPLNRTEIKNLSQHILFLFGNIKRPTHDWSVDLLTSGFKFFSHYLDIDEKTLKVDRYGRLTANYDEIRDQVEKELLSDEKFLKKLEFKVIKRIINRKKKHNTKRKD